jgi:hypothetical protein
MPDYPTPPPVPKAVLPRISGMAIASLVLGILGIFIITALAGLILGILAYVKINDSRGTLRGGGIALAGIIISVIFMLLLPVEMLLPVLGAAKQRAEAIRSIANERQLALAIRIYASDHANHFPPAANWCDAIKSTMPARVFMRPGGNPSSECGYAFNAALGGMDVNKVDSHTVMIFESDGGWNANGGPELMVTRGHGGRGRLTGVAFADGSIQAELLSQVNTLVWNP